MVIMKLTAPPARSPIAPACRQAGRSRGKEIAVYMLRIVIREAVFYYAHVNS